MKFSSGFDKERDGPKDGYKHQLFIWVVPSGLV